MIWREILVNFGEILGFGDFGGNPGVWFLVLPTNYVYTTVSYSRVELHRKSDKFSCCISGADGRRRWWRVSFCIDLHALLAEAVNLLVSISLQCRMQGTIWYPIMA